MTRRRVVIVNDTTSENHYGCSAVMSAIRGACKSADWNVVYSHPVAKDWRVSPEAIGAIQSADLVLVNGEGSLRDDNRSARALAAVAPFCRERKIPAVLLNAGLRNLMASIADLRSYSGIYVRDEKSAELARGNGLSAEVTGDLTFTFCLGNRSVVPADQNYCFSDSVLNPAASMLRRAARALQSDYSPIVDARGASDFRSYAKRLAEHSFVVTGRFHAACFCLNAGIPFVGMASNTDKIAALLQDVFGSTERSFAIDVLKPFGGRGASLTGTPEKRREKFRAMFAGLFEFGERESVAIAAYKTRVRSHISEMWRAIEML